MPASAEPRDRAPWFERVLPPLALAAVTVLVWRGALGLYFSQDDFAILARVAGLEPRLPGPARLISAQAYFDLLRPVAGLDPRAWHLASLGLHLAVALLLYAMLARRVRRPAALVGAAFFAVHPALFAALYWIAAVTDPLAGLFALLTVAAWRHPGALRWTALPLFALALLSKESALPLPLALLALSRGRADEPGPLATFRRAGSRMRDPLWLALAALSAAGVAWVVTRDAAAGDPARAYALVWGPNLWQNLLTYLGWSVHVVAPLVHGFSDARDPAVWGWGGAAAVLWLAGLFRPALRRRGWFAGGAWVAVFLLPYLPLHSHTYHYYLYLPLAGAAGCLAIGLDALAARTGPRPRREEGRGARSERPPRRSLPAWLAAAAALAALAFNAAVLVRRIETAPLPIPGLRYQVVVDRAVIAERLIASLRPALPADTLVRLAVWVLPPAGGAPHPYYEANLRSAVYDGLGLRVMLPQVREVRFVSAHRPLGPDWRWVLARPDGTGRVLPPGRLDRLIAEHGPPR